MHQLYDYQSEAVERIAANINNGIKAQILSAPTGAGKTEIGMALIARAASKGLHAEFVCDRQALVRQTSRRFHGAGIRHGVLMGDESVGTREIIRVSSAQTIQRRGMRDNRLVILDEAHELRPAVVESIKARKGHLVGMTATPFPPKLVEYYDELVNVTTTNKLLQSGILCPFSVIAPDAEVDVKGLKADGVGGEWKASEVSKRAARIVGDAVREWPRIIRERFDGIPQPTVLFAVSIDDGEQFVQRFQDAGYDFRLVSSREPPEKNKATLDAFDRGEFPGLVNVAMLARGWDAPGTVILMDCYPLRKSLLTLTQRYGRIMRNAPSKERALVIDHAGNWLGFRADLLRFYAEGPPPLGGEWANKSLRASPKRRAESICKQCRQVFDKGDTECSNCGLKRPKRQRGLIAGSKVDTVSGVLSLVDEVTGEAEAYSGNDLWLECCSLAWVDTKGHPERARKRALASYHAITQNWPPNNAEFDPNARPAAEATKWMIRRNFKAWLKSKREQERRGVHA